MAEQEKAVAATPTSSVLQSLLVKTGRTNVALIWIVDELGERSFGLIMLLLALLTLVPGISYVASILVIWVSIQMINARKTPRLPNFLSARSIPAARLRKTLGQAIPILLWTERYVRPRWTKRFAVGKRTVGVLLLVLGFSLWVPMPFSNFPPAVVIMALALAYLEQDGLLLLISLGAGMISLAISGATLWLATYGGGLLLELY